MQVSPASQGWFLRWVPRFIMSDEAECLIRATSATSRNGVQILSPQLKSLDAD